MQTRLARKIACHLGSREQRWPVLIALFAIAGLYLALPKTLIPLPDPRMRWLPMAVVVLLATPLMLSHRLHRHRINTITAYVLLGVLTLFMVGSLVLLILGLKTKAETPGQLLRSAGSLWVTNVLVFACWYWRLDAGGPNARARREHHHEGSFLFPQMAMSPEQLDQTGQLGWKPDFVDYLFLAYNSSTALSPADTPVLSRWGKLLMMVQASISFSIIILLAARAVNILGDNQGSQDSTAKPKVVRPATATSGTKPLTP